MSIGIFLAVGGLWVVAVLLTYAARRIVRPSWPFVLRQGVASLYRPGNQTRSVILSLGFGVFLMSTLYQAQKNLLRQLDGRLDQVRANVVFFDVQADQAAGMDSIFRATHAEVQQRVPIVPMRIAAISRQTTDSSSDSADAQPRQSDPSGGPDQARRPREVTMEAISRARAVGHAA